MGITPDYLRIRDWEPLQEGFAFTEDDVRRVATVCLMGQGPAKALFGDASPVGQTIRVGNVQLKVIGLLRKKGASMTGQDLDDVVLAPWTTVKFRLSGSRSPRQAVAGASVSTGVNTLNQLYPGQQLQLYPQKSAIQVADMPMLARFADLDDIFVSVTSPEQIEQTKRQMTLLLRERHKTPDEETDDFRIRDWTEISETIAQTSRLMTNLLLIVATISLIVGGVGIMNIMLVSVTERTREIGLRMAVGAQARDILRQFLLEAALLCCAGGVAGIAMGRAVSMSLTAVLGWPTMWSLPAIVASVGVAVSVGVIFGFYPAWKASRLDPIEALRYE